MAGIRTIKGNRCGTTPYLPMRVRVFYSLQVVPHAHFYTLWVAVSFFHESPHSLTCAIHLSMCSMLVPLGCASFTSRRGEL